MDRMQALATLERVLDTPHRLVDILVAAGDDSQATDMIAAEWDLTREEAAVVLDQQFKLLVRARMVELRHALHQPGDSSSRSPGSA